MNTYPECVKLGLCSWRTLPVPPMRPLEQSSHASSLLLDPCAPGVHHLCRRGCSWCILQTPQAFTRSMCRFWGALPVPPMMQLAQFPYAWSLYSTHVLLARTTCADDDEAGAISTRLGPLLNPCTPGAHYLCRQCCSLCSLRTPRAFS